MSRQPQVDAAGCDGGSGDSSAQNEGGAMESDVPERSSQPSDDDGAGGKSSTGGESGTDGKTNAGGAHQRLATATVAAWAASASRTAPVAARATVPAATKPAPALATPTANPVVDLLSSLTSPKVLAAKLEGSDTTAHADPTPSDSAEPGSNAGTCPAMCYAMLVLVIVFPTHNSGRIACQVRA
jgi:hypothetical protein